MKLALVLFVTTSFPGCFETDESDLLGKWVFTYWEELDSGKREYAPATSPSISIEFQPEEKLFGLGPCNMYGGGYDVGPGTRLSIHSLWSTDRACVEDTLNRWEQRYFRTLSEVYSFAVRNLQLTLYTGKPVRAMVFRVATN